MPDTAGNSLTTATTLNLFSSVQSFPDLVTPENNDYYRFALTTRSSLNLSLTGLDANANVELLDSAGNPVSLNGAPQQSTNVGNFSEVINTTLDPGLYFIRVYPGANVPQANYTLNISAQDNLVSSDLLWRYPGLTAVWTLDGTSFVSANLLSQDLPANWVVGGVGDFNQDGKSDIIWRDANAALTDIWFMDGTTLLSSTSLFPALGAGWVVGGTGDFNKDGSTDILWRNESLAQTDVWFMNSTNLLSSTSFNVPVDGNWYIGAVGDFNRDGNLDILWRDRVNLTTAIWLMDGLSIQAVASLYSPPSEWVIGGAADYNRDGNLDILWRSNGPDGTVAGWLMDRTAISGVFVLSPVVPDPLWVVNAAYNTYGEPNPIDLAGNSIPTALDLGKGLAGTATYRDRVDGTTDPNDFYQFNIANDSRVSLSLTGLTGDLDLGLYDSNGVLIQSSVTAGNASEFISSPLAAGTYYIQVNAFDAASSSTYALSLTVNTPPVLISNNALTLSEQGSANLTDAVLFVTDADNPPAEVTYTVGALPLNGALLINGVTAIAGNTFTQADIDNGNRIRYIHNGSETTSDRFTFTVSDNSGGAIAATTFTFAVTPVNDPPLVVSNLGITVAEGSQIDLTTANLLYTDVDSPVNTLVYSITSLPANGTILLAGTAVTSFTQVDLLSGAVQYRHNGSETTSDRFTFTVSDDAGGVVTSTFSIGVTPVNDPPGLATNLGLTVSEGDSGNILSSLLQVTDPDNPPDAITYSVSTLPANGTLLLAGTAVTSFTQADILSGNLTYQNNGSEATSDRFVFTITDGLIPAPLGPNTFSIAVTPVNDPPLVATNVGLTLSEGGTALISQTRLQTTDPEGQTPIIYTVDGLTTNGVLLRGTQTLSVGQTFTQADINTSQISYIHNGSETTSDRFLFSVVDAQGAIVTGNTFSFNVLAVNDAPTLTLPTGTQSVDQATNTLISGIHFTDVDLGTGDITVTLTAGNGLLSLGRNNGITFLTGDGVDDQTLSFRGTQDVTNFVLQSLIYRSSAGFQGNDTINVTVNDGGNTGLGGPLTDSKTLTLNVAPVNDAPVLTVPGAQTVREDIGTAIAGISIADGDAGSSPIRVSLFATNGSLSLASISGITLSTGDGTNDKTLVFSGPLSEVNRVLSGLSYLGDRDFNGTDTLLISVSDSLNGTNGIPLSDTQTIAITVSAVNDAPVLTVPGIQTVNENTDLRLTGISVTDVDATGDLTMNLFTAGGRLTFGSTAGLTFDLGNGTQDDSLAFRGSQTAINDALKTLIYQPNTNFNGNDTISINVSDGGGTGLGGVLSDSKAVVINVQGINNAPVITLPTSSLAVDSDTNLAISGISIADPDAGGGSLSVSLLAANGILTLGNTTGLTFTQGDGSQDQRLTFSGTLSAINAAIASLTYRSYPGFTNAFDRITIQVNDNGNTGIGVPLSDSKVLLVNVGGAVNQVPIVQSDTYSIPEEGTLSASSVLANDIDPDFTVPLTATLVSGPANAQNFIFNDNGTFTYTPTLNFNGADSFTYRAVDGLGGTSSLATVTINVTPVNDPPTAVNDSYTTLEDQSITNGAVLTNDTDVDNTVPLSTQLISGPANAGAFTFNPDGTFSYTPRANFNGSDRFTYVVIDALGAVSNTATVSITVTPVNDAPIANNDGPFAVAAGGTLSITGAGVLSNDTDVDTPLANLSVSLVTGPSNGVLSLSPSGAFTYRPTGNFSGVDTFTYRANDGALDSNLATVTISVGANNPPIALNDTFTLGEDGTLTTGNVLVNDTDTDNNLPLNATLVTGPSHALSFTLNPDGTFSYQPSANYNGVDTFVYRAIDSLGAISSNPATVSLNITAVNDAPVAFNDTYSVSPGATLTATAPGVLANDTDIDSPTLSAVLVSSTANGTLSLNPNGSFTYRPNTGFTGTDSFTYRANDGIANSANTATVSLVVTTAANLAPIANPDTFTGNEDTSLTIGNVLTNDTDPDNNTPLVASVVTGPTNAQFFTLRPDGSFTYLPNANFNGVDTFVYQAIDSLGGQSAPATVTFSVTPVNDAPTAGNDAYSVATTGTLNIIIPGVLANDTDIDSPTITATLATTAANGSLGLNADGSFTYRPNAGFSGVDSFTYRASDGSLTSNLATVNVTVTTVTNAVPIANPDVFNATEDTLLTVGNVLTNDTDPDNNTPLTANLVAGPANALSFSLSTDGSFSYLPKLNFNGTDTFTYVAIDSLGGRSQTATVTFSVAAVNDAPVAANDTYNVAPASTLNVTLPGVLANDTDVDGPSLTTTLVNTAANGALNLNSDGSFTYTPNAGFSGTDSFTYQASDGLTVSNLATVSIIVTSNQFPTANPDTFTTQEDTLLTVGNVLTNDTDPDNNTPLTANLVTGPANALSFTLSTNGSFSYLPKLNFNGTDTFTYVAVDTLGGTSNTATVTFSVTPVNDPPVAVNDSVLVNAGAPSTITAPGVLANDTDPEGSPLTASLVTNAANGTVTLNGDGSFVYTPNANFFGVDSFTYVANDGTVNSTTPATVTVTVNGVPIAVNNTYTAAIGSTLNINQIQGVLNNDSDPEGSSLSASLVTNPTQGTLSLNSNGSFTYIPNAGATGVDSFTYRATDGFASSTATVTVNLRTNTAPVAVSDSYRAATNGTLNVAPISGILQNDTDANGDPLTATLDSGTSQGSLALNSDGSFTYVPQAGFQGTDSFVYRASDGITVSGPATVTLSVSNNTPPVANNDSYSAFSGITKSQIAPGVRSNDTDANGDTLTVFLVSGPANGTVTLNPDGSFLYTSASTFQGVDTFVYRAFDGIASSTATVSMSVTVNNPPTANPDTYGAIVNQTLSVTAPGVLANDSDPEGTLFALGGGTPPANGQLLNFSSDGSFVYLPNPGFVGVDTFTYLASDGVTPVLATVTISVAGNVAPVANPDSYSVNPNNVLTVPQSAGVLANDTDPNLGQALSASLVTNPLQGVLSLNPDGSFVYTPNAGATGSDTFTYRTTDGSLSSTATVAIAINTTSTPPVAQNDGGYAVSANGTLTITAAGVLANDSDPNGDAIRATLSTNPGNGSVTLNSDGSFIYRPNAGFTGTDSFTYVATDGLTNSTPATVFVTVGGVNAAPVVSTPGSQLIQQNGTLTLASGLSVSDVDAGSNPEQITLSATNGVLTLSSITGLTFTTGDGTGDSSMVFTGTLANINAALTNLQFIPTAGFTGIAQISLVANDQGATGTGGAQTGSGTVSVNVASSAALVTNINPNTGSSSPTNLFSVGNTAYFSATDGSTGAELWRSDGTAANTTQIADINAGTSGSSPANFTVVGNTLYYTATSSSTGLELWRTDLTTGGATLVADIRTGTSGSNPQNLINYSNTLFFVATDGVGVRQLWRLDSNGNPVKVSTSLSNVGNLAIAGTTLFFSNNSGTQLWRLDGATGTPTLVKDLGTGASISNVTAVGNTLFFSANDTAGVELWRSDGTTANTNRITDLNPGAGNSSPSNLVVLNGTLYFFAQDNTGTYKLYQSTASGVVTAIATLPSTGNAPGQLTVVGNKLFFVADTGTLASPSLQLWSSDGTSAALVRDVNAGGNDSVSSLVNFNGSLFFVANDGTGFKVFRSDGSSAGTVAVSGNYTTAPTNLTVAGNRLLFAATDATNGTELWTIG